MSLSKNTTSIKTDESRLTEYIETHLSPKRRQHTQGVADTAEELARRFGMDPHRARLAGLSHDLAREWEPEQMKAVALRDGEGLSRLEEENPLLLHGRAAAQLLREEFGVDDDQLLHAVSHHTLGSREPSPFDLLLYCADYVEPNRRFLDDRLRRLRGTADLETLALAVVEHIRGRGHELAEETLAMARELRRRMESA